MRGGEVVRKYSLEKLTENITAEWSEVRMFSRFCDSFLECVARVGDFHVAV